MNQQRSERMRAPLKWGFVATVMATLASIVWPTRGLVGVQDREAKVTERAPDADLAPTAASTRADSTAGTAPRLQPLAEVAGASAAASFDPFVGLVPPPPPAPPPVAQPAPVVAPPSPPPQDYRFLGRITDPEGVEQMLLGRGETAIPVKVGTALDNGYVVESITTDAIVLIYPPLDTKTAIPIPKS